MGEAMPAKSPTVERRIQFFRIPIALNAPDVVAVLQHVSQLDVHDRYDGPATDLIVCEVDTPGPSWHLRLRRVRGDVLPMLEDIGTGRVRACAPPM